MKHYLRITIVLLALIWALAWIVSPRGGEILENFAEKTQKTDETGETSTLLPAARDGAQTLLVSLGGTVQEMDMGTYLLGVLRAEMPASFELEALKAQAIAARTDTLYRMENGRSARHPEADVCDDITCCKAYRGAADAAADWGAMAVYYEEKLARAVAETDGEVLLYDGAPILAVFFSSSGGSTQGAGDVWVSDLPYLQSVESPEDETLVPNYYSVARFSAEEFRSLVLKSRPEADLSGAAAGWIGAVERNEAGYVASITVGGVKLRGNELRTALSLRSPCFTAEYADGAFTFHVTGYGHGVGMSQYGANALAKEGRSAEEIVTHYFSGASIGTWG